MYRNVISTVNPVVGLTIPIGRLKAQQIRERNAEQTVSEIFLGTVYQIRKNRYSTLYLRTK